MTQISPNISVNKTGVPERERTAKWFELMRSLLYEEFFLLLEFFLFLEFFHFAS